MTDLNTVALVGRITRDLDEKSYQMSASGTARARVSIAVNRSKKQQDGSWADEASFFDVTVWGKTAENLKPYLVKGTQIAVQGYLKQDRWQDKQSGQTRSSVGIVAENIQLVGGKRDGQGQQANFAQPQNYRQGQFQQPQGFDPSAGFPNDIPF